jgi:hypothetical protein
MDILYRRMLVVIIGWFMHVHLGWTIDIHPSWINEIHACMDVIHYVGWKAFIHPCMNDICPSS